MAHCNIKDPETGLWNCWSTIVDDYLFDEWLTEDQYRVAMLIDDMYHNMEYNVFDYEASKGHELISYEIKDGKCIITVDDINMIKLEESPCYTKAECDETKLFRAKFRGGEPQ